MRPPLRMVLPAVIALALTVAGAAAAGNGGFAPPSPESPNAERITDAYWLIFGLTAGIFVLVEGTLIFFVVRYRSRGRARNVEGPQVRGHTRLEVTWTVVPVLILAAIAAFVFYKLPGIKNVPEARAGGSLNIKVFGHQFYWQYRYPNGAIAIDTLVVPVREVVTVDLEASDVVHSWWAPNLAGKTDAIPGKTTHTWFRATKTGRYRLRCAEFCGLEHAHMTGWVVVVSRSQYQAFLASHRPTSRVLGDEIVSGVCAKCHGLQGQGDIGPRLQGNALLNDRNGLETLLRVGRKPTRTEYGMPAVGKTWSREQMNTAIAALKRHYGS